MFRKGEHEKYGIFTFGYELFKKFIVNVVWKYVVQLLPSTKVILPGSYKIVVRTQEVKEGVPIIRIIVV